ncbi:MAG TPA: UDP-N-acetylmuramate dehydrogenase [Streptosporangiaceae bacterium]|nr:UDP-N-acetylmuramate dehydrogenase [Streptosporangiaceae bacterium]
MLTERVPLSGYTTLRLGGPAARLAEARTADDLAAAVRAVDASGKPLLVLGGGSNLVVCDEGFGGTVLRVATSGVSVAETGEHVLVTVAAGENWDRFVEWAVAEKLAGIECLAGIPGLAGATPIQNVGAYGQEVAATITSVTVLDRASGAVEPFAGSQCGFGYRTSLFKRTPWPAPGPDPTSADPTGPDPTGPDPTCTAPTGRYVVLDVTFALERDPMSAPVRYAELARKLAVEVGDRAPLADVRAAVLDLRRGKGMVLDPDDADTVSAGSFFTNPVLSPAGLARLQEVVAARDRRIRVPTFPAGSDAAAGSVKVPAAWLIEQSGFGKGYPGHGAARISAKHTLALTNAGGASAAELIGLAREIVAGVRSRFCIELANEPVLVGLEL